VKQQSKDKTLPSEIDVVG